MRVMTATHRKTRPILFLLTPKRLARFWSYVNVTEPGSCWEWTRARDRPGYGSVTFGSNKKPYVLVAHRVAWTAFHRRDVPSGLHVLHSCHNPPCCNPHHLRPGTDADNSADRVDSGRQVIPPQGESSHLSKLTRDQAMTILTSDRTQRSLALEFGVSQGQISRIRTRKQWKHLRVPAGGAE